MSIFPLVPLGKVCEHVTVGHVGKTLSYYRDSGVPFLRTQNVGEGCLLLNDIKYVTADFHKKLSKSQILSGDVLISRVISDRVNCAVVPENFGEANCANVIIVRPGSKLNSRYLAHFISWPATQSQLLSNRVGSAQSVVNTKVVNSWLVPLPPLEEQHRIVAILDKADAIRRKRFEAIRLTEELLRAAFLDMFGDPVTNPKGWEMFALEHLVVNIESGWSPKCDFQEAKIDEWGVLKLGAVTWGHFNDSENKALLPGTVPRPELEVKPGDLLFSRKNTYELVGASAFVHTTRPKLLLPDLIFRLCLKDTVNPVYVWQVLSQETMRTELSKLASGSAGSMPNISKARLRTLCLPVPPLEAQLKYYQIAKLFWKEQNHHKEFLQSSDKLFNSLLHRAFRGEL